jgi:pyruvate dehydrogenase E2 component (dihydrolipoamide acetyltransferase)
MIKEFKLPELGENIHTADVTKILVKPGDKVDPDMSVLEIETDKATVEVPAEMTGVVKEVLIKEGDKVKIGAVIFTVETEGGSAEVNKEAPVSKPVKEAPPAQAPALAPVKEAPKTETVSGKSEFVLPALGENIKGADITKLLVKPGDFVEVDQTVIEIETDKATVEVPSDISGVVKEVFVQEGGKALVGQVLFTVEGGRRVSAPKAETTTPTPQPMLTPIVHDKITPADVQKAGKLFEQPNIPVAVNTVPKVMVPAAPSVRRFAREIGININLVMGRGPGGRISVEDVKAYAKSLNEQYAATGCSRNALCIQQESLPDFAKWGDVERKQMSNIRRKTAEHLSYSWASIPHVTQFDKADITKLEEIRKQFSKKVEAEGGKLTITAILIKVIASALKVFPQFNSSVDMEKNEIVYKKYFNIGLAVDTDRGLLVPVIRDVDRKNIIQLSKELNEVSAKARDKKLSLDEMQGGSFTISNLGGIGGTYFTPVVNSPEVAILGVSRGSYEPVFIEGHFVPRLMLPLSLSYDHRVIDGADGARFIRWVIEALENPFLLSLEG